MNLITLTFIMGWTSLQLLPAAVLGPPGQVCHYELAADPHQRPEYEREHRLTVTQATFQLGPMAEVEGREHQWFGLSFTRLNGATYQLWLLLDAWPRPDRPPHVARYVWAEPPWPDAMEYVHEATGQAVLPRFDFWSHGWPQDERNVLWQGNLGEPGFPERIHFQGYPFQRTGREQVDNLAPPAQTTLLRLNPDVSITALHQAVDVDGLPAQMLEGGAFRWRAVGEEEVREILGAGFNFLWSDVYPLAEKGPAWGGLVTIERDPQRLDWVWRTGTYVRPYEIRDWPQYLYRSNTWGVTVHADEPVTRIWPSHTAKEDRGLGSLQLRTELTPQQYVRDLETEMQSQLGNAGSQHGRGYFRTLAQQRFGLGNLPLQQHDYPVWEASWETAWYQMAAGADGLLDEDLLHAYLEHFNMAHRAQIPLSVENLGRLHTAVLRGAARNFGRKWGTAVYGRNPRLPRQTLLSSSYRAGATYFWFWAGWPGIVHVRDTDQRYLAEHVRQEYRRHPNRDLPALLHAAKVAIALPYGYVLDLTPMFGIPYFNSERVNAEGVKMGRLWRHAALEIERCLREGLEFDLVVDEPRFQPQGYEEIVFLQADGRIRIVRDGHEEVRDTPREPHRPSLGPGPTLTAELVSVPEQLPGKIVALAHPQPGSGMLRVPSLFDVNPVTGPPIYTAKWEVYGPHNTFHTYLYGEKLELEVQEAGPYRLRAVTLDEYGRSEEAWLTVENVPGKGEKGSEGEGGE